MDLMWAYIPLLGALLQFVQPNHYFWYFARHNLLYCMTVKISPS